MTSLRSFARNVYSQYGEDGILAELFNQLSVSLGYFVEFGAWDGIHLSNCHALLEQGWEGCYIEGDAERYRQLCQNISQSSVHKIQRFVAIAGPNSLDEILKQISAPNDFDLLSIDIDGDDLAMWRSLTHYRPKCIVIEYNPTIPFDSLFENIPGETWGNSALSIDSFGRSTGYSLMATTETNLIYLDDKYSESVPLDTLTLADVAPGLRYFWGYDGTLLKGSISPSTETADIAPEFFRVPWAGSIAVQPIPRFLRLYKDEPSILNHSRRILAATIAIALRPASSLQRFKAKLVRRFPGR